MIREPRDNLESSSQNSGPNPASAPRTQDKLSAWGLKATQIYVIALVGGIPISFYIGALKFGPLSLNELGDFMAGAFGPLAIFWLVLGFFQQGKELRHSVDALNLQARELQNSVEQQERLVKVTESQLLLDEAANKQRSRITIDSLLPHLSITSHGSQSTSNGKSYNFKLTNTGKAAIDVSIEPIPKIKNISPTKFQYLAENQESTFNVSFHHKDDQADFDSNQLIVVRSQNSLGWKKDQKFKIGNFQPISISTETEIPEE